MVDYRTITVTATLGNPAIDASAELSAPIDASAELSAPVKITNLPTYDGAYEVTPTRETQVLDTALKAMSGNVIVKPIPSNYGLITWNGSTLNVS